MKRFFLVLLLLSAGGCASVPPRQVSSPVVPPLPQGVFHTVEKGQTLWRISKMYNVDLRELMRVNGLADPSRIETGSRLRIPGAPAVSPAPAASGSAMTAEAVERCVSSARGRIPWRTITLHHSATRYGNAKVFDRSHRSRGMGGLFYHFLIGNGNGLGDGRIEVGWRWKRQREVNRPRDIQICLVGNFTRQQVSEKQYDTLKKLVCALEKRYRISSARGSCVRRHCDATKKATECPGGNFPYSRLLRDMEGGT